ncbi:MAG: threonylcarbamoyl-AMP synthase [Rhodobacteraceae bacterium]|nr:threonylcarbamoyl-AMP synthase [Paracoccaceae bacterium]
MPTKLLPPTEAGVAEAADILRAGGLVAFPTETVYGLGADARSEAAVARIFEAKGRPRFNPLIAHIPDLATAEAISRFSASALSLAKRFWPGPLTLVADRRDDIPAPVALLATAGLDTVGVRVPAHAIASALLRAFGGPVAAPSANLSGAVSPTTAAHVLDGLEGKIDAVIDGGPCAVGVESTILRIADSGEAHLLRPGGVPAEDIETELGRALLELSAGFTPSSPGQLESHYAPKAKLRLNAIEPHKHEAYISFGPHASGEWPCPTRTLSPTGDLSEAAVRLFSVLRELDALTPEDASIAVAPIPEIALGVAINDRLRRAAAPRPTCTEK